MRHLTLAMTVLLTLACGSAVQAQPQSQPTSEPSGPASGFDHGPWNQLLITYVTDGLVDYAGLAANPDHSSALDAYLAAVATASPDGWSREERLAFRINAYNALVVRAVLTHGQPASVLEVEGFFDGLPYSVAGASLTLNDLENGVRATFEEPRIHFAFVCAATSCPPLRSEAWSADRLESQLDEATRRFVQSSTTVHADEAAITVSRLFEWYAIDFGGPEGVRELVASYLNDEAQAAARDGARELRYSEYDWALNAQP